MEDLTSLADLLDLQHVDLQIDRLLNERGSLSVLVHYRAAHDELTEVTGRRDEFAAALREVELGIDKTNGELELMQLKLSQEQNRLYAGGLSARDADYLRREVEMLTRKVSEMEDEVLELMERREELLGSVAETGSDVDRLTAEKQRYEAEISEAWQKIDAELGSKEARKTEIVSLIPQDLIDLYEELREAKEGVAVGRLAEGVCGGCHLALTPAEQLDARRTDPPRCIHCRRILVP